MGPDSREKWLLPPGKFGRSDSQIGRKLYFLLAITHTIAIKWKKNTMCHHILFDITVGSSLFNSMFSLLYLVVLF